MPKNPKPKKNTFPETITVMPDRDEEEYRSRRGRERRYRVLSSTHPAPDPDRPRTQAIYKLVEVQEVSSTVTVTTKSLKK